MLNISIVSGNNQAGDRSYFLKDSIVFIVTDGFTNPVRGITVDFEIVSGGGSLDNNQMVSGYEGTVYTKWKVGGGPDQIIKAYIKDDNGHIADEWAVANADIALTTDWISDVQFYKNLTEPMWHDNKILETNSFLIFSDGASDNNKVILAKIAEENLRDITEWFEISYGELGLDKDNRETKLKIYAHTNTNETGIWRGAKNYGILFKSYDSPGWFRGGLKHELTHMVELLLIGPENFVGSSPPSWFSEGIAEYLGGFTCICPYPADLYPVKTRSRLDTWISSHKNPLTIAEFSDIGSVRACEYYEMFGIVMKYLLDPRGQNINCNQLKGMYADLAVNKNFSLSFEQNLNLSLSYLEDHIYTWLMDYLPAE